MANGSKEMSEEAKKNAPPYTAFQTLKTLTGSLKQHGLPPRIDKSIMTNFSGAVAAQLMTALRFLNLIDDSEKPTALFVALKDAHGTDQWPTALRGVLKTAYAPIFKIDLATATPNLLYETFTEAFAAEGETLRKAVTFFLNAAEDAEVTISPYIKKHKKPRQTPAKPRAQKSKKSKPAREEYEGNVREIHMQGMSEKDILLGMLDTNAMDQKEQEAIWTLLKYLAKAGK